MEIKNNKTRKGFLVAGLVFGLAGWGTIAWGYSNNQEEAPGNSDDGRILVDDSKKVVSKESKQKEVASEDTAEESISEESEEVGPDDIIGTTEESSKAIEEQEAKEVRRVKDISELESDQYLDNMTVSLLTQWSFLKGRVLKAHLTENLDKLNGLYVYSANVVKAGEIAQLDLGFTTEKVPSKIINSYKDFFSNPQELQEGSNALALVDYKDGKIIGVELYQEESSSRDEIQHAILKTDVIKKEEFRTVAEQKALEEASYEYLTVDDWKGMTLLANRDIINNGMAPIFVVPNTSLKQKKGDLEGTFYYMLAGVLTNGTTTYTQLTTYEGKTIDLDFGVLYSKEDFGTPVWMHVITQDGVVENVEIQKFEGANIKTMSEGMLSFIGIASAEMSKDE